MTNRTKSISIHALLTESDSEKHPHRAASNDFNPRSPHGERRISGTGMWWTAGDFNPRSPHGERPRCLLMWDYIYYYFNPRSPHGERQDPILPLRSRAGFQSTLSSRRATFFMDIPHFPQIFQSTLSSRRATDPWFLRMKEEFISIHALLTESDRHIRCHKNTSLIDFNPRSPHGERPIQG